MIFTRKFISAPAVNLKINGQFSYEESSQNNMRKEETTLYKSKKMEKNAITRISTDFKATISKD